MKFVKPTLFQDAITKLGRRQVIVSGLDSEAWSRVPVALRERAFFSSRIENARFLQRSKDLLTDWLAGARESITLPDGTATTALKTGSRAQFIEQARQFALSEGMGPIDPRDKGGLKDITSAKRLGLIFDTQTRAAHDFGNWLQGQDPDLLAEFPASRFIREREVTEPRDTHWMHENEVRLKTDLAFWTALNRDFGVPWGPWGWGCGHAVEDVDRSEAERLGLLAPGQAVIPAIQDFNTRLQASASNLDQETLDWLEDSFGDQVKIDRAAGTIRWAGQFGRTAAAVSTPVPGKRDTLDALVTEKATLKAKSSDLTATEILTVGIERLHTDPLEFYTADREYFEFVLNTLRNR